ncbi:MAG: cyclic nucleotide-binding domain-containing protein [Halieaceae bacterium]|jgi:CRP-like cAMP-binding protein|nr:cyclic nucleotide-binding domain-containing protein [Halieaceae bacterium]
MLASVDLPDDFRRLNEQFRALVQALVDDIDLVPVRVEVAPTISGNFRGFDAGKFYIVDSGTISVRYAERTAYLLEEGDILLPDIAGTRDPDAAAYYGSEAGASLGGFSAIEFMQQVLARPGTTKLWTRLLVTYTGLMLRIAAMHSKVDLVTTPGFGIYEPGEVIIMQGERAQYVFNLTAGLADVLVDDVPVGIISPGEIFGAMAALTHADRSATVRARSRCSVVKVPTSQFTDLIKSNPATIHALLTDMANSIASLNEQLVQARREAVPSEDRRGEPRGRTPRTRINYAHGSDHRAAAGDGGEAGGDPPIAPESGSSDS